MNIVKSNILIACGLGLILTLPVSTATAQSSALPGKRPDPKASKTPAKPAGLVTVKAKPGQNPAAAAKANKPVPAVGKSPPKVSWKIGVAAKESELNKKLDEVLSRVAAVETETRSVDARLENAGLSGECPPPKLSAAQEQEKADKEAAIAEAKGQRDALEKAIAGGLPRETVADTLKEITQKIARLSAEIAEIRPVAAECNAASLTTRLAALEQAVRGLAKSSASPPPVAAPPIEPEPVTIVAEDESAPPAEDDTLGLTFGLEIASAYVFRGFNVFQETSQMNQHALLAPSASVEIDDTGLGFGYWAGYQWTGTNRDALVKEGLGAEQDLVVSWSRTLVPDRLTLLTSLFYYFYPFAVEAAAGTLLPSYLEPGVGLTYTGHVTIDLTVSYFAGLQEALADYRYLSVRPTLSKEIALTERVSAAVAFGGGYKLFNNYNRVTDNVWNVQVDWKLPVDVGGGFAIEPGVHGAWTNLADASFGDEYVVWLSVATTLGI